MWTDINYNVLKIHVSCLSFSDTRWRCHVVAADVVRVLGVLLIPDLSLNNHVTAVSSKRFSPLRQLYAESDVFSTLTQPLLSLMLMSPAGLTTVTVFWSVLRRRRPTNYSVFSTLRSESSPNPASKIKNCFSSVEVGFIGWTSSTGSGSESVSRCSSAYTTWRLDTCRLSVNPCPAFMVVDNCAQPITWTGLSSYRLGHWARLRCFTKTPYINSLF